MRDHDLYNELTDLHVQLLLSFDRRGPRTNRVPLLLRYAATSYVFDCDRMSRASHLAALAASESRISGSREKSHRKGSRR